MKNKMLLKDELLACVFGGNGILIDGERQVDYSKYMPENKGKNLPGGNEDIFIPTVKY